MGDENAAAVAVGCACASIACVLALYQIVMHLSYYNAPQFQRYIIRIIFMVPVYAICSAVTLAAPTNSVYVSTIRDCYEVGACQRIRPSVRPSVRRARSPPAHALFAPPPSPHRPRRTRF